MSFNKDHRRILTAINSGLKLIPMQRAGNCMEDGFSLIGEVNGLKGFGEVPTSSVIYLERRGFLGVSMRTLDYFVTKTGIDKIGE